MRLAAQTMAPADDQGEVVGTRLVARRCEPVAPLARVQIPGAQDHGIDELGPGRRRNDGRRASFLRENTQICRRHGSCTGRRDASRLEHAQERAPPVAIAPGENDDPLAGLEPEPTQEVGPLCSLVRDVDEPMALDDLDGVDVRKRIASIAGPAAQDLDRGVRRHGNVPSCFLPLHRAAPTRP